MIGSLETYQPPRPRSPPSSLPPPLEDQFPQEFPPLPQRLALQEEKQQEWLNIRADRLPEGDEREDEDEDAAVGNENGIREEGMDIPTTTAPVASPT